MFTPETRKEVEFIAEMNGWNPAALLAVVETESAGTYEWDVNGQMRPPIRWEGHYFYRRLKGTKRAQAVREGLAHPRAGGVKNPRSYAGRYDLLWQASAIDGQAALESISMGLGQVMGAWWKDLGYESVDHMFDRAKSGISGQVELMARFIEKNGLGKHLTGTPTLKSFHAFARGYNGKAYKKSYATGMFASFKRWSGANSATQTRSAVVSEREDRIKAVQKDLTALGYEPGKVDGNLGKNTKAAVRKFQTDNALAVDGVPGPMVREALTDRLAEVDTKKGDTAVKRGVSVLAPTMAADGAGQFLLDKVETIQASGITSVVLDYTVTGLTIVGVGLLIYGLYKKFNGGDYDVS